MINFYNLKLEIFMAKEISREETIARSKEETRNIVYATQELNQCTFMLDEELLELETLEEFERDKFRKEGSAIHIDNQDVWKMINDTFGYQDYFVKNSQRIMPFVLPSRVRDYLFALKNFEQAVSRIDPDYPFHLFYSHE